MKYTTVVALSFPLFAPSTLALCMTNEQCPDLSTLETNTTSDCQSHHLFVARGSTSPYPGHQSDLVRLICQGLNETCSFENVIYPAANGPGWCNSSHEGAVGLQQQMASYTNKCPDSNLIVLGFSQGGSVVLDALGGGGGVGVFGCEQPKNEGLDPEKLPALNIAAAVAFGPTVRAAGQTYTVKGGQHFNGTSTRSQTSLQGLEPYSKLLREYCQPGDPICARGSTNATMTNHLNYFDKWNEEAAQWVIKTVQEKVAASSGSEEVGEDDGSERYISATSAAALSALKSGSAFSVTTVLGFAIILFLT